MLIANVADLCFRLNLVECTKEYTHRKKPQETNDNSQNYGVMQWLINLFRGFLDSMSVIVSVLSFGRKKLSNSLSVYVKSNTGGTLTVDLNPEWDIKDVKEIVAPQLGLTPQEVKIIFAGKELSDSTQILECDLGQKSILHVVKSRQSERNGKTSSRKLDFVEEEPSKPLSQTLVDLQLGDGERSQGAPKAHFYIHCSQCARLCNGKLRVRCGVCRGGAFTVHRDPENWPDVLTPKRITGHCETVDVACIDSAGGPPFAEFYFKCAEHPSQGENDYAAPLNLIKTNLKEIPCLACSDISNPVLVFSCQAGHVTCLDCFRLYCTSRLGDRQFMPHPEIGYTLPCPVGCENSFIEEIHHFKLLTKEQYERYQRFAAEEFVLQAGGVLCPQPGCGMGLLVDEECTKVTCQNGCGYVFCRQCRQGYHLGECLPETTTVAQDSNCQYAVDPAKVAEARWDEASSVTIKVISKPCPKCRTPTERAGGCMHMVCTRAGCSFEWCWICQTTWTRDCMGAHWFG